MIVYDNIKQKYEIVKFYHLHDYYHNIVYKTYNVSLNNSTVNFIEVIQDKLKTLYN
jgi:hypothetical protein